MVTKDYTLQRLTSNHPACLLHMAVSLGGLKKLLGQKPQDGTALLPQPAVPILGPDSPPRMGTPPT